MTLSIFNAPPLHEETQLKFQLKRNLIQLYVCYSKLASDQCRRRKLLCLI